MGSYTCNCPSVARCLPSNPQALWQEKPMFPPALHFPKIFLLTNDTGELHIISTPRLIPKSSHGNTQNVHIEIYLLKLFSDFGPVHDGYKQPEVQL